MKDQRGVAGSAQWALLTPLMLVAMLGIIHAGLVMSGQQRARQVAVAAAERVSHGNGAASVVAPGLRDVSVRTARAGNVVTVEVRGAVATFWGPVPVTASGAAWAEPQ